MRADLTPEDWAAADSLAELLGVSSEELAREFVEEFEALTPEEQAEFMQIVEQANEVLPKMDAALNRIEEHMAGCRAKIRELHAQISGTAHRVSAIEATFAP